MAAFDLNMIHKYSNETDLLSDTLVECERLLWELEYLAKKSQPEGNSEIFDRLNLVRTQKLLCERLMIGQRTDSLVILIKHYAEILRQPHVEIGKATPS